jgi:hypothetical protein
VAASGALLTALAALVAGCRAPAEPHAFRLPPSDTTLDPARLAIGAVLYACGAWHDETPPRRDSLLVVDLLFHTFAPLREGDPAWNAPSPGQLRLVTASGGTVLETFPWMGARARIAAGRIPALAAGDTVVVYAVPNERRFDWNHAVFFQRAAEIVARPGGMDELIDSLGGRVTSRWPPAALAAELPRASVLRLRARSDVRLVSPNGVFCPR